MKKSRLLIWIFILLFTAGCSGGASPGPMAKEQANTVLECVMSDDAAGIKELLSPETRNLESIDDQITDFLEFIDGNIISFDEVSGGVDSATVIDGETVIEDLTGRVRNIKTDTGKTYMIFHYALRVNAEDPDEVGIYYICVLDEDAYDPESGYPDTGKAFIGQLRNSN